MSPDGSCWARPWRWCCSRWSPGLHLDGLADTADGLGSRRPADQALEIRRSDAGPFGVATLVLVLLVQVCALASLPHGRGAAGLVLAAVTGRVAVVLATGSPPARPSGFSALVAGRTSAAGRAATVAVLLRWWWRAGLPGRGAGRGPGGAGRAAGLAVRPDPPGGAAAAGRDDR